MSHFFISAGWVMRALFFSHRAAHEGEGLRGVSAKVMDEFRGTPIS